MNSFNQNSPSQFSRRALLGSGLMAGAGALFAEIQPATSLGETPRSSEPERGLNVRAFGAAGDGKKDDTGAFRQAMLAAARSGNYSVFVPRGNYLIADTLEVPANVALEGVFHGPCGRSHSHGSTLLAVAGAGDAKGKPFIQLNASCCLRGITVFYPEQKMTNPPVAYPWTIRGSGDNISLIDVLLVNPYQAVDFGTLPAGRHYINRLYGQPLYRGLFIDQCYDVGRIENIHFWSFWGGWDGPLYEFMRKEAVAFVIGRTDWEFMNNCFCIGYNTGYKFVETPAGAPNCVLTQCGSDIGPTAVRVDQCQAHAGLSFVNGQFMAGIEIAETNHGPVKFTACGFWGIASTDHHAMLNGTGHTTFSSCHFVGWGQRDQKAPAIHARRGGVTVTGCDFQDRGKAQLLIEPEVDAALVFGNRFNEKELVTNRAGNKAQLAMNIVAYKA